MDGHMSRKLTSLLLIRISVFLTFFFPVLFAPKAMAQGSDTALRYFKNYFVTGDYATASVGLRGTGTGGYARGTIDMNAVPCTTRPVPAAIVSCDTPGSIPSDIVAAYLYWETEETFPMPVAEKGFFRGQAIVGKVLGSPNNPACLSSGGPNGTANGSGRVYRADVLRYLPVDHTYNVRLANGHHDVKLADSGGNGNGNTSLTNGATLVVVYRIVVPGQPRIAPLRAVVSYDGAFTLNKFSDTFTVSMGGFYQASPAAAARITPIAGNGQPGFKETLNITVGTRNSIINDPIKGSAGGRWDSTTYNLDLAANDSSYSARLIAGNNQVCVTLAAFWTSTNVTDDDFDGLLNTWELNGMHLDPGDPLHPATFGGCADGPCVDLHNMGANPNVPDVFVEIDWMKATDEAGHEHVHIPKYDALSAIGQTFALHGITMHFDVGKTEYPGFPFIVPPAYARGGDVIDESKILCHPSPTTKCAFNKPYSVLSWKKGTHAISAGFRVLGIERHFDRNRKDIFRYALFAHALAGPFNSAGVPLSPDPGSTSGVADGPGADLMITMGLWRFDDPLGCDFHIDCSDQTGTAQQQAGTFMHELGHTFGLSHAGLLRTPNCIPIYPSVMNYLYQTRGLTDADGFEHVDFSSGRLHPLDEDVLPNGGASLGNSYRIRYYGPTVPNLTEGTAKAYCDGTSNAGGTPAVRVESPNFEIPPDWHRNGPGGEGNALDVNYSGAFEGTAHPLSRLMGDSDDWSNLNLQQVGARRNVNGLSGDVGEADLGEADLGEADLGEADLGEADLGEADLGEADLGEADLGEADLGERTYDMEISALDATSTRGPLTGISTSLWISMTWGQPVSGQIRANRIYRSDPDHSVPRLIAEITGTPPVPSFKDQITDFLHSGATCPIADTCPNTTYTYYITSVDINGTESAASTFTVGVIKQLLVTAVDKSRVFGTPNPAVFDYVLGGIDPGSHIGTIVCGTTATQYSNFGSYPITCSGLTAPDGGPYDGVTYFAGTLKITKANAAVSVFPYNTVYDSNPHTATYTIAGVGSDTGAAGSSITLNTTHTNAGTYTTDSWSFSGGINYNDIPPTTITDTVTKANAAVSVTPYNTVYDSNPHTATYTITGVGSDTGAAGSSITLNTTHTNAGTYTTDSWSFSGGINYKDIPSTTITDTITKANATVVVIPYDVAFDGSPHTAASTITGVGKDTGATGSSITLNTTHTLPGTYVDTWSFSGGTNYKDIPSTGIVDHIAGFTLTGSMTTARSFHTATLLNNGKVLVTGGLNTSGAALASAELYDPATGTFTLTGGNMPNKAAGQTATLLLNGTVLVVGGGNSSSEVYNPVNNSWSSAGGIGGQRTYHTATLLPNGKVLIAGGSDQSGKTTSTAMLYDPTTGSYSDTGSMKFSREFHTATLIQGKVLITGGRASNGSSYTYPNSAELYDPATGVFTTVGSTMSSGRYGHTAVILDGKVVIAGGANAAVLATTEIYNPAAGTFSPGPSMANARQNFAVAPYGAAIVEVGGSTASTRLASAEQYQGGPFISAGNMNAARAAHTATRLNDGSVLIIGGQGNNGKSIASAELLK